ncbi:transmembrane protein 70, mitochondrial [Salvelinus fontinalis]|uniref:transmembrane protein 70, mitochondrial n=1 Tax=Salvelinus sp. IW2-2015 TaxID=2691554 RepID=UPI000CDFE32D|nr:transmembrane protein 70, mitochondrial [Salvelinus alpinus]XP_055739340.1 transmembrane protein 70, mitochondrial [Salvelinus fontinalis]
MFQLYFARGLRTGISQTFRIQFAALRYGRPASHACRRLPLKTREQLYHTVKRSFLNDASNKVQLASIQRMVRNLSTSSTCHSEEGKLIYSGSLGNAVRGVKMFSYTSSGASLCVMPYILLQTGIGVQSLVLKGAFCGVIGFFTFLTPILLHIITKGYVVRLYHNQDTDTYTAVTYNVLLMEKKTVFRQSEVKIPSVSKMLTTFYADKKSMLVNPMLFPLPHDYNHLMGYDKPFSFDTEDLDDNPNKS